jgi:hypothetical protein
MKRAIGILAVVCVSVGLCLAAEFQSDEGKRVAADYVAGLKAAKAKYAEDLVKAKAELDEKKPSATAAEKQAIQKDLAALAPELKRAQGEAKGEAGELKGLQTDTAQKTLADYKEAIKAAKVRYVQDLVAAQRAVQLRKAGVTDAALKATLLEDMNRMGEEEQQTRLEIKTGKYRRPPADPTEKSRPPAGEPDKAGGAKLQCAGSAKAVAGLYVISGEDADRVWTDEVPVPFKARIVAMTDSTNLRIQYGRGRIIFNSDTNPGDLVFETISAGRPFKFHELGNVAPHLMATIDLVVTETTTEVIVDGKTRVTMKDNCKGVKGKLGIGPSHGSLVTVKSVTIEPLKEDAAAKEAPPAPEPAK